MVFPYEYILSDEEGDDEFVDEWDDGDDDIEYEEEVFVDAGPKKKMFGIGSFLFLMFIIFAGLGGGYYFISIPEGEALRAKIPPNILSMIPLLPIGDKQQVATQTVDNAPKNRMAQQPDVANSTSGGFSAPPMPLAAEDEFDDVPTTIAVEEETASMGFVPAPKIDNESEVQTINFSTDNDINADDGDKQRLYTEVNTTVAAVDTNTVVSNIKTEALVDVEDRLAFLEKAISNIEQNMLQKNELIKLRAELSRVMQSELMSLRQEIKKMSSSTTKQTFRMPRTEKSVQRSVVADKAAGHVRRATTRRIEWILQSAQPGTAWIAEKGKNNRKAVSVGERIAGLGKITAVEKDLETGRWVVRGTKGSVHQ